MKTLTGRIAAILLTLLLASPAYSAIVEGHLLGVFSGNDTEAGLLNNLGIDATLLARVNMPESIDDAGERISDDGLSVYDFQLNSSDEAVYGQWSYTGTEIANIIVLKSGSNYAVFLYDDELSNNMANTGLFETGELGNKGLSHISAYSARVVPVPAAVWLFASALLGLGIARRKPA